MGLKLVKETGKARARSEPKLKMFQLVQASIRDEVSPIKQSLKLNAEAMWVRILTAATPIFQKL